MTACGGKPSGISDEFYEKYKILGAPKILYQCGDQIGYSAGVGMNATYNHIVGEAKSAEKSLQYWRASNMQPTNDKSAGTANESPSRTSTRKINVVKLD